MLVNFFYTQTSYLTFPASHLKHLNHFSNTFLHISLFKNIFLSSFSSGLPIHTAIFSLTSHPHQMQHLPHIFHSPFIQIIFHTHKPPNHGYLLPKSEALAHSAATPSYLPSRAEKSRLPPYTQAPLHQALNGYWVSGRGCVPASRGSGSGSLLQRVA